MAFLITSPMVDQVVVVLLGEAMGLTFTVSYILVGSIIGVIGGLLIDFLIPVAEVLLNKGVPIGTILAFTMSVVAISLPEMLILRKVLKVKMLLFFAGYLFLALIFVGYFFNFFFGG